MKQTFVLRGKDLGSREIEETWASDPMGPAGGARFRHTNLAYFCPVCGEIWGRVWYERAMPGWRVEVRNCPEMSEPRMTNGGWTDWKQGSFLCPFPEHSDPLAFAEDMPEGLVRHEFTTLINKF